MRQKGRYFSVRFSAALLERLEAARTERYGERTTLAEAIRRLLEEGLAASAPRKSMGAGTTGTVGTPLVGHPRSYSPSIDLRDAVTAAIGELRRVLDKLDPVSPPRISSQESANETRTASVSVFASDDLNAESRRQHADPPGGAHDQLNY